MIVNLNKDEKIILELRRHWFIFFLETIFLVVFIVLPFIILMFLEQGGLIDSNPNLEIIFRLGVSIWFLFSWITFFIIWTNFYLDVWIITNQRIIDVEQYALFKREIYELRIEKIQDVSVNTSGFFPTVLSFGDILVETAGEKKTCTIKDAPHPEKVKNIVSELQFNLTHQDLDKSR